MFVLIFAAALAVAAPAASPASSPSPTPTLHVIAHVRSDACMPMIQHANAAIASALRNDGTLTQTIRTLHGTKLDESPIERRNALQHLGDYADALDRQAIDGDKEIKALRAIAATETDPTSKKELVAFADWLGGAMWRQRKIARDLNGFVATMDAQDMTKIDEPEALMNEATLGVPDPRMQQTRTGGLRAYDHLLNAGGPLPNLFGDPMPGIAMPTDDQLASYAADDFQFRLTAIANDERNAADHAVGATSGC